MLEEKDIFGEKHVISCIDILYPCDLILLCVVHARISAKTSDGGKHIFRGSKRETIQVHKYLFKTKRVVCIVQSSTPYNTGYGYFYIFCRSKNLE